MDPLTHALIGAGTSYALFGRKLGRRAAVIGAVAGLFPDIDNFVTSKQDPLLYVQFHRFFTHSIFFAPIGALLATLPWVARRKLRPEWKQFWACAFPAYLTHCFLDTATTYGTQLLWPFTNARLGWDLISVIDPIFTVVAAAGLIVALRKQKLAFVNAALLFCIGYLALGGIQRTRAARAQAALAAERGHAIERSEVMPTIGNNLVWRSLYQSTGQIYSDRIRVGWFSRPSYREGTSLPLVTGEDLRPIEAEGNRLTRAFERFAWFSDHWVARSPVDETVIGDMRYSISTQAFDPIWGIRFVNDGDRILVQWVSRQLKRKVNPGELWAEIVGQDSQYRPLLR